MNNWFFYVSILLDALFICTLLWVALTDIKKREIYNVTSVIVALLGIAGAILSVIQELPIIDHLLGLILATLSIIPGLKGVMGGGDFKLLLGTGLYLGLVQSVIAIVMSAPAVLCLSAYYLLKEKTLKSIRIPLAPLIGIGCLGSVGLKWITIVYHF